MNSKKYEIQKEVQYLTPVADIYEGTDSFTVVVEMPGVKKDSLSLTVEGKELNVKGIVSPYHGDERSLIINEIQPRNYYRVFNLGNGIDTQQIDAELDSGILTITLPKLEEAKPKEIQIK